MTDKKPKVTLTSKLRACQLCTQITGKKYSQVLAICGRCRVIKKADFSIALNRKYPLILTEENRYKGGRTPKLSDDARADVRTRHHAGEKIMPLAKEYGVSVGTIWNALHPK